MKQRRIALALAFCLLLLPVLSLSETLSLEEMGDAEAALSVEAMEAAETVGAAEQAVTAEGGVPYATSFWDMNPDEYDLKNPAHQQAVWDLMMQPITVLDVGQTDHVYPTNAPGIDKKPWKDNTAGELHGQSQGVHVLEEDTDGDGYVLVEAYSNDGTKTEDSYMKSIDNKRIRGYVKTSLLKTVEPWEKYALLVDKLYQKLYIFEAGAIIGELDVSTGLNNAKQPYNETPAGEFITISWVGESGFPSASTAERRSMKSPTATAATESPASTGNLRRKSARRPATPASACSAGRTSRDRTWSGCGRT